MTTQRIKYGVCGLIIILILVFGVGVANGEYQQHSYLHWQEDHGGGWDTSFELSKVTIPEDNKTCYIYDGAYSGGIYCFDGGR